MSGTVGADGRITASAIHVRQQSTTDATAAVMLMGAIESLTDQTSFVVRGVPVDAADINLAAACPGVTLAVGAPVRVTAALQIGTDVVLAKAISCPSLAPPLTMRSMNGTAGAVNAGTRTFMLANGNNAQQVQWNDMTVIAGTMAANMGGAGVVVDGYLDASGTLIARTIRNPAAAAGRMNSDAYTHMAASPQQAWSSYRNRPR